MPRSEAHPTLPGPKPRASRCCIPPPVGVELPDLPMLTGSATTTTPVKTRPSRPTTPCMARTGWTQSPRECSKRFRWRRLVTNFATGWRPGLGRWAEWLPRGCHHRPRRRDAHACCCLGRLTSKPDVRILPRSEWSVIPARSGSAISPTVTGCGPLAGLPRRRVCRLQPGSTGGRWSCRRPAPRPARPPRRRAGPHHPGYPGQGRRRLVRGRR